MQSAPCEKTWIIVRPSIRSGKTSELDATPPNATGIRPKAFDALVKAFHFRGRRNGDDGD